MVNPSNASGRSGDFNPIVPYLDLCRVANAATIEAGQHKARTNHDVRQREVLEVKEVHALTKDLRLMVLFDLETLLRVATPKTLF